MEIWKKMLAGVFFSTQFIAYYWLIGWSQLRFSGHVDATAFLPHRAASGRDVLRRRLATTLYTVARAYIWIIGSTTSPQKPPVTMILDHIRTQFLGGATYTWEQLIREYARYTLLKSTFNELQFRCWQYASIFIRLADVGSQICKIPVKLQKNLNL